MNPYIGKTVTLCWNIPLKFQYVSVYLVMKVLWESLFIATTQWNKFILTNIRLGHAEMINYIP